MTQRPFSNSTVLVTGGSGGLGRACVERFITDGATVVVCDVASARFDDLIAWGAAEAPGPLHCIPLDLSVPDNCTRLPRLACDAAGVGHLEVLVNAVGVMRTLPFAQVDLQQWQRTIDINLTGVFLTLQAAAALMRPGGSIVTLSSVAGRSGRPNAVDYSATKTALLSLTKSAAAALAPDIRVNAVCPGLFLTSMWEGIIRDRDADFGPGAGQAYLEEVAGKSCAGRPGEPAELAAVVAFLAGDQASFVTGQAINVDGGLEMD